MAVLTIADPKAAARLMPTLRTVAWFTVHFMVVLSTVLAFGGDHVEH